MPISYADLPLGSGTWDSGSGTTIAVARALTVNGQLAAVSSNLNCAFVPLGTSGYGGLQISKDSSDTTNAPVVTWRIGTEPKWTLGMDVQNEDFVLAYDWSIQGDVLRLSPGGNMVFGPGIGTAAGYPYQLTVTHDVDVGTASMDGITVQNGQAGIRLDLLQVRSSTALGVSNFTGGVVGMRTNQPLMLGSNDAKVLTLATNQSAAFASSLSVNGDAAFGGGVGVLGLKNAATNPSSNPSGGGVLYENSGSLVHRGSSGTVTTLAPA